MQNAMERNRKVMTFNQSGMGKAPIGNGTLLKQSGAPRCIDGTVYGVGAGGVTTGGVRASKASSLSEMVEARSVMASSAA